MRRRVRLRAWLALAGPALAAVALVRVGGGVLVAPPLGGWGAVERWYEQVGPAAGALALVRLLALIVAIWLLVTGAVQLLVLHLGGETRGRSLAPACWQRTMVRLAGVSLMAGLGAAPAASADQHQGPGAATIRVLDEPVVVVAPGDSFWTIAEAEVSAADAPSPSAEVVAPYWRRLIEANQASLVEPGNPDLIHPGQRLTLPPDPA